MTDLWDAVKEYRRQKREERRAERQAQIQRLKAKAKPVVETYKRFQTSARKNVNPELLDPGAGMDLGLDLGGSLSGVSASMAEDVAGLDFGLDLAAGPRPRHHKKKRRR